MSATVHKLERPSLRPAALQRSIFWMGDIVVVRFPRVADGPGTDQITERLKHDLSGRHPKGFIFDALGTETYSVDVRAAGARMLSVLAKAGADRGVCVAQRSSIRMIGTAVAFVAGVNVEFKRTMQEALHHLSA